MSHRAARTAAGESCAFLGAYADRFDAVLRRVVEDAAILLQDEAFDAIEAMTRWEGSMPEAERFSLAESTALSRLLPYGDALNYTPLFFRRFAVVLAVVGERMASAETFSLSCLADFLAFKAIFDAARRAVQQSRVGDAGRLDQLGAAMLADADREGIVASLMRSALWEESSRVLATGNPGVREWFAPYGDAVVHPYARGEIGR